MAAKKRPPTETETIVETTSRPQVDAPRDYWGANVAGILVATSQMAICQIPACTSQFFERLAKAIWPGGTAQNEEKKEGKNVSAKETKEATAATSEPVAEVFHEAMSSYEKALKSGIQVQEESVNLWKDLLTKLGSPEEFQAKLESMRADALPKARERMEEFVETFNRMSNQTIDLFEKTLGVYQAGSVPDAQRRMQDLIESSLTALRTNVQSALNTDAKIITDWKELVDRFGPAAK
jgi:hypothetical protein